MAGQTGKLFCAVALVFGAGLMGIDSNGQHRVDMASLSSDMPNPFDAGAIAVAPSDSVLSQFKAADMMVTGDSIVDIVSTGHVPPAYCFTPGTPLETIEQFNQSMLIQPGPLAYNLGGSWSPVGAPVNITWSFVPDGLSIFSTGGNDNGGAAGPSSLFATFDAQFGNRATWVSLFEQSFARWAELTGTSYTRITFGANDWDIGGAWGTTGDANHGDVRIASRNIDGAGGSNVLAYNFFPTNSDMVIDSSNFWASATNNFRFLRDVVMHEHGHGLGIFHVCPVQGTKLMEPFINTGFDGPQHDDIRAGQRHYGDPFEPDNTSAEATDIGAIPNGPTITVGTIPTQAVANSSLLSIDANSEQDWFRFSIDSSRSAAITLTPIGTSYDDSPQACGGSDGCCSGNVIDSRNMANLAFEVYSEADLVTPIVTANTQGFGVAESVGGLVLDSPGNYFIRVFETQAQTESQLYTLDITAVAGGCCLGDGTCEQRGPTGCQSTIGNYFGDGTDCSSPPNPVCTAASTIISCELASGVALPGGSVRMDLFVEEVNTLSGFQATVGINKTSGVGDLTVGCPDGVRINLNTCFTLPSLVNTGVPCDTVACPGGQVCLPRPDFVFSGLPITSSASCTVLDFTATLNTPGESVDVGPTRAYLGEYTLDLSGDATPGSTFEITIDVGLGKTFLIDDIADGILFQASAACVLTVADPTAINPPLVASGYPHEGEKNRYISFTPNPLNGPLPHGYQVTHVGTGQSWIASSPRTDSTAPGSIAGLGLSYLVSDATPPLYDYSAEAVVHVGGCMIAPNETYEVRATLDGTNFTAPIVVSTVATPTNSRWWSDVVGVFSATGDGSTTPPTPANAWTPANGNMNGFDVTATLRGFQKIDAPDLSWTDLNPEIPDRVTNGNDILRAVNAFATGSGNEFYPFNVPNPPGPQAQGACPAPPLESALTP